MYWNKNADNYDTIYSYEKITYLGCHWTGNCNEIPIKYGCFF